MDLDDYTLGWWRAHYAIQEGRSVDYSQGDAEWDKGWNARLDIENDDESE